MFPTLVFVVSLSFVTSQAAVLHWRAGFHPFPLGSSCICRLRGPDGEGDVSVLGEIVTRGPVDTQ